MIFNEVYGDNMIMKILFKDKTKKTITIKRFSDLSTHKSNFYYYEEPYTEHGKGVCISRDNVDCIEVVENEYKP